jgi:Ca2+-binding RTX toxin-like protein
MLDNRIIVSRNRTSRLRSLCIQPLEERCVLSAASLLGEGTVLVVGSDEANSISVGHLQNSDFITIRVDDSSFTFPSSAIRHIHIRAQGGDDIVRVRPSVTQTMTIEGGDGNDLIVGSQQRDLIYGGDGHDRLLGQGGNDSIDGGSGGDWIEGGSGNDRLSGADGVDIIFGGSGDDQIHGGDGGDYLIGGSGDDDLYGGGGADWIFGDATDEYPEGYVDPVQYARDFADTGSGHDKIYGGDGNDIVFGGNGHDLLHGGDGSDLLVGGAGRDEIQARDGVHDVLLVDRLDLLWTDPLDRILPA